MKSGWVAAVLLSAAGLVAGLAQDPAQAATPKKMDLKVLYVGGSGEKEATLDRSLEGVDADKRMASFEALLKRHFTQVDVKHARDYRQQDSMAYDVTVMDGTPKPIEPRRDIRDASGKIIERLPARYFTEDFDRPVVTIAALGEQLGRSVGVKFDWYCLCLDAHAHSMRMDHPIFKGPFPVNMTLEERPTPEEAFHYEYFRDTPTPKTLPMLRIQTRGYKTDEGFRIGMVARPWGFEDSPDAEYISSGVCAKTLDAVALGRHGNFFGWGFAASPDYMTEEGKAIFANAVAYISTFNGQGLIARKYHDRRATKDWIRELKYLATREALEARNELNARFAETMLKEQAEARAKQARGETLTQREQSSLRYTPAEPPSFEGYMKDQFKDLFAQFGTDTAAYHRYYGENYDYFYSVAPFYKIIVDEDVKSLGIPNTDPRILAKAIELWESGQDADKAQRILTRYTLLDYQTPKEWRAWYEQNKSRLFFTQTGGFVFMVNTRDPGVAGNSYAKVMPAAVAAAAPQRNPLEPADTDGMNPVTFKAGVVDTPDGRYLTLNFKVHPGFHMYSHVSPEDPFIATRVEIQLPAGYAAVGELIKPAFEPYNEAGTMGLYRKNGRFAQQISGKGAGTAIVSVTYQTCDAHVCLPPETLKFSVALN